MERVLVAQLNRQHFRGLKATTLRWLAGASFPVSLQAQFHLLPDLVAFWAVLAQALCLLLAVAFAWLEALWHLRSGRSPAGELPVRIHTLRNPWEALRSALWCGLGLVSLAPLVEVGFDRPLPKRLVSAAVAAWAAVLLLAVVAEAIHGLAREARAASVGFSLEPRPPGSQSAARAPGRG